MVTTYYGRNRKRNSIVISGFTEVFNFHQDYVLDLIIRATNGPPKMEIWIIVGNGINVQWS